MKPNLQGFGVKFSRLRSKLTPPHKTQLDRCVESGERCELAIRSRLQDQNFGLETETQKKWSRNRYEDRDLEILNESSYHRHRILISAHLISFHSNSVHCKTTLFAWLRRMSD